MDEPTAVLPEREIDDLFGVIRELTAAGSPSSTSATASTRSSASPTA